MTSPSSERHCLLIVEDDDVDALTVERLFRRHRVTNPVYVLPVAGALTHLRQRVADAPASCIVLGTSARANEIELLRQVRQAGDLRHVPVIVAVVDDEEIFRIEGLDLGVGGYVVKPVSQEALERALVRIGVALDYAPACPRD